MYELSKHALIGKCNYQYQDLHSFNAIFLHQRKIMQMLYISWLPENLKVIADYIDLDQEECLYRSKTSNIYVYTKWCLQQHHHWLSQCCLHVEKQETPRACNLRGTFTTETHIKLVTRLLKKRWVFAHGEILNSLAPIAGRLIGGQLVIQPILMIIPMRLGACDASKINILRKYMGRMKQSCFLRSFWPTHMYDDIRKKWKEIYALSWEKRGLNMSTLKSTIKARYIKAELIYSLQ